MEDKLFRNTTITKGCWLKATSRIDGYVQIRIDGVAMYAHRIAYQLFVGELIPGMEIDHLCFVRNCINPEHLEQVTPEENKRRARRTRDNEQQYCQKGHRYRESDRRTNGRYSCNKCFLQKFEEVERELLSL